MTEKKKPDDEEEDEEEEGSSEDSEDEDEEEESDSDEDDEDEEEDEDEDQEEEEEEEDEDEDEEPTSSEEASPEAIARRVAALGADDDVERIAREEEKKLQERKKKRTGAKKGLQAAASRRLKKIAARAPKKRRPVASAIEAADPLLERTAKLGEWARKNQKVVYILGTVVAVGLAVFGSITYLDKKKANEASSGLAAAVADERGRIGDPDEGDDPDRPKDLTPIFKTAADRREAALTKYRSVTSKYAGTGAATLARLAEGSLLLDKRDPDGAAAAFLDVKSSPLAQADSEVRGRALEGLGFAYELKATLDAPQKDKHLDDAIKEFRELENTDVVGFKELGMYHQGRVFQTKGDKDKAIEELKSLHERLTAPGANHAMRYLEEVSDDRLRTLDPSALPPKQTGQLGGPGGNSLTEAQMRALMDQMKQRSPKK
jgi:hypothetical protein